MAKKKALFAYYATLVNGETYSTLVSMPDGDVKSVSFVKGVKTPVSQELYDQLYANATDLVTIGSGERATNQHQDKFLYGAIPDGEEVVHPDKAPVKNDAARMPAQKEAERPVRVRARVDAVPPEE